jgi:hypothetical protein
MRFRRKPQPSQSEPASQSQPEEFTVSVAGGGDAFHRAIQEAMKGIVYGWTDPGALKAALPPAFPHERQEEPIRATKAAYLIVRADGVAFSPLNCSDGSRTYPPQAVAECLCYGDPAPLSALYGGSYLFGDRHLGFALHPQPERDNSCGFYAWKPEAPFPWQAGTWLLETDLYGRVIEHQQGYRAQKQRVLSISPLPAVLCDEPSRVVIDSKTQRLVAECPSCLARRHPVSVDRLRKLLNVEVDMGRAWGLREASS